MNSTNYDIIVIGGGIVGLATAYKLTLQNPNKTILVLEKEKEVAAHQTGHNSGVIHSGIYYKPGSYKAVNCVKGRRELVQFVKDYNIPHDICGKIIVATDQSELAHMSKVFNNGLANDVEGIEMIDSAKIREIEPHCQGISGIWVHAPASSTIPMWRVNMWSLSTQKTTAARCSQAIW
jgi:L-2-hydroxyglutarate oxidase LhgO